MDMHVLGASRTSGGGDGGSASDDYMRKSGKTGNVSRAYHRRECLKHRGLEQTAQEIHSRTWLSHTKVALVGERAAGCG